MNKGPYCGPRSEAPLGRGRVRDRVSDEERKCGTNEGTGRDENEGRENRRGTRGKREGGREAEGGAGEGRRRTYFITAFRIHVSSGVFCPEGGFSQLIVD